MGDHAHVAPHAPVARRVNRHSLTHHAAVARIVADGQVFHFHVVARDHEGGGQEGAAFIAVFVQILGAALGGDDGAVPRLSDDAHVVLVHHHALLVFVHAQKQNGGRPPPARNGVDGLLDGCKISAAVFGDNIHDLYSLRMRSIK